MSITPKSSFELSTLADRFVAPTTEAVFARGKELTTIQATIAEMDKLIASLETQLDTLLTETSFLKKRVEDLLAEDQRLSAEISSINSCFTAFEKSEPFEKSKLWTDHVTKYIKDVRKADLLIFLNSDGPYTYGYKRPGIAGGSVIGFGKKVFVFDKTESRIWWV
jgi:regulator of replication initiation timing